MRQIKHIFETLRFVASVIILLSLSISNAWGTDYTFINQSTGKYTGDFYTGVAEGNIQTSSQTIKGLTCPYYVAMAGTGNPGTYYTDRYVMYDIKTTTTQVIVYYRNNTNQNRKIRLGEIKEGKGAFETIREKNISSNTNDTLIYNTTNTKNSTIYITVNNTNVRIYQVVAHETGSNLMKAGEGGYTLDFNKGRAACGNGLTTIIDNITITQPSASYTAASTTYLSIPNNVAKNISFTTPASPGKLKLTFTGGQMKYNTSASATGATNVTSGSEYILSASTKYYLINTGGSTSYITKLEFVPSACTAPTNVTISGTNKYLKNQDISLTATPTGHTGTPTYQWEKQISGVWTDVTNGDNISGATTNNLQITGCTHENSGQYRCKVSTGEDCDFTSDPYGVHVFTVYGGYVGDTWSDHEIVFSSGTTGTATIHLNAGSLYKFHIRSNNGAYYSNGTADYNGDGTGDAGTTDGYYTMGSFSGWNFGRSDKNFRIYTGAEGDYTITVNIANALVSGDYVTVDITYPTPVHPSEGYAYFEKPSEWTNVYLYWYSNDNSRLTGWSGTPELTATTTICGKTYYYTPLGTTFSNVIFKGNGSNQWTSLATSGFSAKYLDKTDYDHPAWANFTTYTISFNAGGGSGTMSSITGICPNDNQAIPANSFTKTNFVFDHWTADVDVRVGGATVTAGDPIADGATIQNINSDITLTAQWAPDPSIATIPGTVNKANRSATSDDKWFSDNTDYYNFGDDWGVDGSDGHNLSRWIEWNVRITTPGEFLVTEESYCINGHTWELQLYNGATPVGDPYITTDDNWGAGYQNYTQDAKWDLSGITPGTYTLRVKNHTDYGKPKLKSLTFALAGLSLTYTKTPDEALYGKDGDSYQASGTINDAVVTTSGITPGASVSASGNVLTIGSVTITAPLTQSGRLDDIPHEPDEDDPRDHVDATCTWRFDHWENVPATVTADVSDVIAVYFPTFDVEYELFGGDILDDPYYRWYRYTGRSTDITPLPENVIKEGYMFGGWYQNATTQLFTGLPGHYYGGYTGAWCLKAHWLLPCDEPQTITKVTLTGSSSYETAGYNNKEYVGTPVISVSGTTATYDVDEDGNDETGYELGTAEDLVFVTVKDGFRTGDIIRVAITATNTAGRVSSSPNYLDLFYGTGAGDATRFTHLTEISTPGIYSYTLSADDIDAIEAANATSVGVYRKTGTEGQNPCVYSIEVFGCRDLIFDDHNGTHVWNDPLNWAPNYVEIPSYSQATRILKPCIVNIADAQAMNVKLCKGIGNNGSLTINADAALSVRDRVSEVHDKDFTTLYPVAASDLVILSNASNQGALVHGDNGSNTHATVQFYARGNGAERGDLSAATWQYMGVPFSDVSNAQSHYYDGWMCQWIENTVGNAGSNWKWIVNGNPLYPFTGYCLTQNAAKTYTNTGTLVPSTNRDLTVTYTTGEGYGYFGWNMFANSYMAPINIAAFEDGDFVGEIEKTIYLFNTGISDGTTAAQGEGAGAGQYVTIPVSSAGSMLPANRYIAPMQGFYILATAAGTNTVTLNYDRLVRKADHSALSVGPNRAKKEDDEPMMARIIIDVKGAHFSDRLYVFENAEQTNGFDNGWDGWKFEGEAYAPQLMTRTGDLDLAVDVSPAFDGKRIAFRVGEDTEYTLHFSTTEEGLYLRDLSNDMETEITEGGTYTFMAFNTTAEERFEIIDRRAEMPNGLDEIMDNATYDILDMTVYTAEGRLVLRRTTDFNKPLNLPETGVYIINLNTTNGKQVHKIIF